MIDRFASAFVAGLLASTAPHAQTISGGSSGGCTIIGSTCLLTGASGTGPDFEVAITGDTVSRVAIGMNTTDIARVSFGPGGASNRDLFLERVGAASLRFGAPDAAAPVAQTLGVQNVVAGTSNTGGAALTIAGSQGTGNAYGGFTVFKNTPKGGSGTAVNALGNTLTVGYAYSTLPAIWIGQATPSDSNAAMFLNGSTVTFQTTGAFALGNTTADFLDLTSTNATLKATHIFGWGAASASDPPDVPLRRDNPGILAQRNANNGQILRVGYNFTDASNYSWGMIDAGQTTANTLGIGSRSVGSPGQKLTKLGIFVDSVNQFDYAITTAGRWTSAAGLSATAFFVGATAGASCGAGVLNPITTVVTNGIVTTC